MTRRSSERRMFIGYSKMCGEEEYDIAISGMSGGKLI